MICYILICVVHIGIHLRLVQLRFAGIMVDKILRAPVGVSTDQSRLNAYSVMGQFFKRL